MQEHGQGGGNKNKRKKLTRKIKCRWDLTKPMEPKGINQISKNKKRFIFSFYVEPL